MRTFSHLLRLLLPLFDLVLIDKPAERMAHLISCSVYQNNSCDCFSELKGKAIFGPTLFSTCLSDLQQTHHSSTFFS